LVKLVAESNGNDEDCGEYSEFQVAGPAHVGAQRPPGKNAENKVLQDMPCLAANQVEKLQLLGSERREKKFEGGT